MTEARSEGGVTPYVDGQLHLFNGTVGSLGYIASHPKTSKELCIGYCGVWHIDGLVGDNVLAFTWRVLGRPQTQVRIFSALAYNQAACQTYAHQVSVHASHCSEQNCCRVGGDSVM